MIIICANPDCKKEFDNTGGRKNRKYCSKECSLKASNEATKRRYQEKKNKTARLCESCESKLSRYSEDKLCSLCIAKNRNKGNVELRGIKW